MLRRTHVLPFTDEAGGRITVRYLTDPDGLGIEAYADRPRETWGRDGRQIAMATEPLDVSDLMREATSASWTGVPRDTVVGHVHLHVGDLARAADFYHEALGLDRTVWSYPGALFLSAGGYHHHLGTNTWSGDASPPDGEEAQLLEWTLLVPDTDSVEAVACSLEAAGFNAVLDDGDCRTRDPWGTGLRIATSRP